MEAANHDFRVAGKLFLGLFAQYPWVGVMVGNKKRSIPRPRVPDGEYIVEYMKHWTFPYMVQSKGKQTFQLKLVIQFVIAEGDYKGIEIARCYNVEPATGKRKWKASPGGDLWIEYCLVMDGHVDTTNMRLDEIPIGRMKAFCIKAKVSRVERNQKDIRLVGGASYSRIENLLGSGKSGEEYLSKGSNYPPYAKPIPLPKPIPEPVPVPTGSPSKEQSTRVSDESMGKYSPSNKDQNFTSNAKFKGERCGQCGRRDLHVSKRVETEWTYHCNSCSYEKIRPVSEGITQFVRDMEKDPVGPIQ